MDSVRSTSEKMNLWPVEHFCPPIFSRSVLIWKKLGDKSVQLVRGSFFRKYFLWNPYFSNLKNFANSRPSVSNFKSFSQSLEHFFLTIDQNNFGKKGSIRAEGRTIFAEFFKKFRSEFRLKKKPALPFIF